MGAFTLGPLVLSADRAYAALGFIVLILLAELIARRTTPKLSTWAWATALAVFVGARFGFVVLHANSYASEPWTALFFWQGGFNPWIGVATGALASALMLRREPTLLRPALSVGALALASWFIPAGLLSPAPESLGVTMPNLYLTTLDGAEVALAELGEGAIVNVWATWCPPCRREMPLLVGAARSTPGVQILLVNQREGPETIRAFLREMGLPEDGVLLDQSGLISTFLDVAGLPTTFAFNARGEMVDVHLGEISAAGLNAMIQKVR